LTDRVVYTAAVGACLPAIDAATRWSQRTIDFATWLNAKQLNRRDWLVSPFAAWDAWRAKSIQRLHEKQTTCVLTADIAGFFENVSLPRLFSELTRVECPDDVVGLLSKCLNHWAQTEGRGLPQGVLASDVLAKLYLESFDRALKSEGYRHVRYTDDIRLFCRSQREAKRALVRITALLRDRGLTLQSAKTQIRDLDGLEDEFDGAYPVIRDLNRSYIQRARDAGIMAADPSLPISVIDDLIRRSPNSVSPTVIRQAFRKYVLGVDTPNRSVLHYVLRRMAKRGDETAVAYCVDLLIRRPEETNDVLRYFEGLGVNRKTEASAVRALVSPDLAMYDYQHYQILSWLWRNVDSVSARTLRVIRKIAFDGEAARYVRAMARALLGKFGDQADLERLLTAFNGASDPLERAQLLCSLTRLERGRRNALLGRVKSESEWVSRAVRVVRSARTQG
jgi:hypothetical protein